jgi:hydrogenase-4 component F
MKPNLLLFFLLLPPALAGLAAAALRRPRWILSAACAIILAAGAADFYAAWLVLSRGPLFAANGWLFLDELSAYNLAVMALIFMLSSLYAWIYFGAEMLAGRFSLRQARLFSGLWCGAFSAMSLVLVSNNLGIMWVGIEATTLMTAFLICIHSSRGALEAMWKYILMCSVGVAFAFIGTLLAVASARGLHLPAQEAMLWTNLNFNAAGLDPMLIKAAFIFLLVGYGTKAGLAPMHNWLPDAHSQAPAPVSAIFSGFMLNTALYCLMRYIPIVEKATGHAGWSLELLTIFGLFSILVAGAFIIFQRDLKRFLAYSSVEHLGIISLGLGLGGAGVFAALFHLLNHSLCKTLAFFSAGRLGQIYGGHEMDRMRGSLRDAPVWGLGMFGAILALIGVAPFALFMSEFLIVKAAVDARAFLPLVLFLLGAGVVFVGALSHALPLAWGQPVPVSDKERPAAETEEKDETPPPASPVFARPAYHEILLVAALLLVLLVLGLWMPEFLRSALVRASGIIRQNEAWTGGPLP